MQHHTAEASIEFANEDILRQAIRGLLLRMHRPEMVEILHGRSEIGKDIVFRVKGPFGEAINCACVVKNHRITGNVAKSAGGRAVLHQAEQALDTPYLDSSGREITIQLVYVFTPFVLDQAAIASLKGKLKARNDSVVVVGGTDLFELFRKHWPEYIVDEHHLLQTYLASAKDALVADSALMNFADRHSLDVGRGRTTGAYVNPSFCLEISTFKFGDIVEYFTTVSSTSLQGFLQQKVIREPEIDRLGSHGQELTRVVRVLEDWEEWTGTPLATIKKRVTGLLEKLEAARTAQVRATIRLTKRSGKQPANTEECIETRAEWREDAAKLGDEVDAGLKRLREDVASIH